MRRLQGYANAGQQRPRKLPVESHSYKDRKQLSFREDWVWSPLLEAQNQRTDGNLQGSLSEAQEAQGSCPIGLTSHSEGSGGSQELPWVRGFTRAFLGQGVHKSFPENLSKAISSLHCTQRIMASLLFYFSTVVQAPLISIITVI